MVLDRANFVDEASIHQIALKNSEVILIVTLRADEYLPHTGMLIYYSLLIMYHLFSILNPHYYPILIFPYYPYKRLQLLTIIAKRFLHFLSYELTLPLLLPLLLFHSIYLSIIQNPIFISILQYTWNY